MYIFQVWCQGLVSLSCYHRYSIREMNFVDRSAIAPFLACHLIALHLIAGLNGLQGDYKLIKKTINELLLTYSLFLAASTARA